MKQYLFVGGLVAAGFDPTGSYLLTVSHSGRGVFLVGTWQCIARDTELSYPQDGHAVGIGPIKGVRLPISELNYDTGELYLQSPDGKYALEYEGGTITVIEIAA